jgi:hypothetical protein
MNAEAEIRQALILGRGGPLPPLRGKVAGEARRMRGVARSATASRSSAQFVIASRIRATASSVDAITSSFGNLRTRKP